jgi:hypothetical protein
VQVPAHLVQLEQSQLNIELNVVCVFEEKKYLPESEILHFYCFKLEPCLITNFNKNMPHINREQKLFENYKQA